MNASGPAKWAALATILAAAPTAPADQTSPAWTTAHLRRQPMTAAETKAFMKRLAQYVHDHHLKKDPNSPQRGMVYEYFQVARKGRHDQWVQGEGLDTMHDGAWLAAAMVNACRATGDPFYRDFLARWQMPFYCRMLNHSDELFVPSAQRNDARPGAARWDKPWAFQAGEKGFIPYFWDDGASVSLERIDPRNTDQRGIRPCVDFLAGKCNPRGLLSGYSQGMSNHMAQDIAVMVQQAWLLFREGRDEADAKLAGEIAVAARNLHECRVRHWGVIPMCAAAAALAGGDADLMNRVPDPQRLPYLTAGKHYAAALYAFQPGKPEGAPGFADDQQYRYYYSIARTGGELTRPLAFRMVYEAFTEPLLYRCYSDDAPVPAGINRFDLYPFEFLDGRPGHYRSDRKGPGGRPLPVGSRMGPQNMICCGWALQVLREMPGIWEEPCRRQFAKDLRVYVAPDAPVGAAGPGQAAEPPPTARADLDGASIDLLGTRTELRIGGTCRGETLRLEVFSRPDARGASAAITLARDKTLAAVNDQGQRLLITGEVQPRDDGFAFRLSLPYTLVKGQNAWANGIEYGRYSIRAGDATRNFLLASREEDVAASLRHELAGGLRTWEAIFDECGYIPTGLGTGRFWDGFSDSGGYAHLLSAAAQWLLCLEGKSDWQVHNVPVVLHAP